MVKPPALHRVYIAATKSHPKKYFTAPKRRRQIPSYHENPQLSHVNRLYRHAMETISTMSRGELYNLLDEVERRIPTVIGSDLWRCEELQARVNTLLDAPVTYDDTPISI